MRTSPVRERSLERECGRNRRAVAQDEMETAADLFADGFVSLMGSGTLTLCESIERDCLAGELLKEEVLSARLSCQEQRVYLAFS